MLQDTQIRFTCQHQSCCTPHCALRFAFCYSVSQPLSSRYIVVQAIIDSLLVVAHQNRCVCPLPIVTHDHYSYCTKRLYSVFIVLVPASQHRRLLVFYCSQQTTASSEPTSLAHVVLNTGKFFNLTPASVAHQCITLTVYPVTACEPFTITTLLFATTLLKRRHRISTHTMCMPNNQHSMSDIFSKSH